MFKECGFFDGDLNIYLRKSTDKAHKVSVNVAKTKTTLYKLLWVTKGKVRVKINQESNTICENNFQIIPLDADFFTYISNNIDYEYMFIEMHPSIFKIVKNEPEFMRAFHNTNLDELVYNLQDKENENLCVLLNMLKECLEKHYNRSHIISRLFAIISELCIIYDNMHPDKLNCESDSATQLIDYINRHYLDEINYETIKSRFYLSAPSINTMVRNKTGYTLWNYISYLRLTDAKKLVEQGDMSLVKIAESCGYNNYSTFYRAYKKQFGLAPHIKK